MKVKESEKLKHNKEGALLDAQIKTSHEQIAELKRKMEESKEQFRRKKHDLEKITADAHTAKVQLDKDIAYGERTLKLKENEIRNNKLDLKKIQEEDAIDRTLM